MFFNFRIDGNVANNTVIFSVVFHGHIGSFIVNCHVLKFRDLT